MRMLASVKLSQHKYKTPEGYLLCQDAILSRTGKQSYIKSELFPGEDSNEIIEVDRPSDEVFAQAALASFENKPVCIDHPDENVGPENYNELSVGHINNIRKSTVDGQPVMIGDLLITNADAINDIENGIRTELSCGYDCDIIDDGKGNYKQINIRGNHIALCEQGRAGIARIIDKNTITDSVGKGTLIQEFGKQGKQYKIQKIIGNVIYAENLLDERIVLFKKDEENIEWAVITKSEVRDSEAYYDIEIEKYQLKEEDGKLKRVKVRSEENKSDITQKKFKDLEEAQMKLKEILVALDKTKNEKYNVSIYKISNGEKIKVSSVSTKDSAFEYFIDLSEWSKDEQEKIKKFLMEKEFKTKIINHLMKIYYTKPNDLNEISSFLHNLDKGLIEDSGILDDIKNAIPEIISININDGFINIKINEDLITPYMTNSISKRLIKILANNNINIEEKNINFDKANIKIKIGDGLNPIYSKRFYEKAIKRLKNIDKRTDKKAVEDDDNENKEFIEKQRNKLKKLISSTINEYEKKIEKLDEIEDLEEDEYEDLELI